MKIDKNKKNPWIAAVLNFIVPGIGYIYAGKKRTETSLFLAIFFGLSLAINITVAMFGGLEMNITNPVLGTMFAVTEFLYILMLAMFAWDAFRDVEEK
jgi:hypothetical protein